MNKMILKDKFWNMWFRLPLCKTRREETHEEARSRLDRELLEDASIISVNCTGGEISNALGLRFNSPFINMSMERNAFVDLCADLKAHMTLPFEAKAEGGKVAAALGPFRMVFPHDSDPEKVKADFARRSARINFDKLVLIIDDQGLDEEHLKAFSGIDCFRKICLTSSKEKAAAYDCCYLMDEYAGKPQTGTYQAKSFSGLHKFETMWDYVSFLNSGITAKKVLIVMHNMWDGGGIQKVNTDIASSIKDPAVEIAILSLHPRSDSSFDRQAEANGVKVIYLSKKKGVDLAVIPQADKAVRRYRPDVIHINQRMTTYMLFSMMRAKSCMYVVHNLADMDAHGITRKINRFAFRHLGLEPVAISDRCRRSVSEVYGLPEEDIRCIYNGVDTDRFSRKTPYVPHDECTFMTVCGFRPQKNLPLLVRAFERVHEECPAARLVMIGDGECMEGVKALIDTLGLTGCVDLPGKQSNIPEWLEKADAFVSSSDWEGLPISILEAMSAGLPVIATDVGGVADVVEDGKNGFLVRKGDAAGLAEKMIRIAKSPKLRTLFSERSAHLAERYSMKNCAENYKNLYLGRID